MAELSQGDIQGEKVTQQQSSNKRADFREERISAGAGTAGAVVKGISQGTEQAIADDFAGDNLTLEQVNANVDNLSQSANKNIEGLGLGAEPTDRQIAEQTDLALRKAGLTQRGLQEALNRNLITESQARVMSNIALKKGSNTLVGSLITKPLRNIYGKTTGNPSGSPAVTFTKGGNEQLADAKLKAEVTAKAEFHKLVQTTMLTQGKDEAGARQYLEIQSARQAQSAQYARDKEQRAMSDNETLVEAGNALSLHTAGMNEDLKKMTANPSGVDPTELRIKQGDVQILSDRIMADARAAKLSPAGQEKLKAELKSWRDARTSLFKDLNSGTINQESVKSADALTTLTSIQSFPESYIMAKNFPELSKSIGVVSREAMMDHLAKMATPGINDEPSIVQLSKRVEGMVANVNKVLGIGVTPEGGKADGASGGAPKGITPTESNDTNAFYDNASPQARAEIDEKKETDPVLKQALHDDRNTYPDQSIRSAQGNLETAMSGGSRASVKNYVESVNIGADRTADLLQTSGYGDYQFAFGDVTSGSGRVHFGAPRGLVFPKPVDGQPDFNPAVKAQAKSLAILMARSPSLWNKIFTSSEEATLAYLNDGYRFPPQQVADSAQGSFGDQVESDLDTLRKEKVSKRTLSQAEFEERRARENERNPQVAPEIQAIIDKELEGILGGEGDAGKQDPNRFANPNAPVQRTAGEEFANRTTVKSTIAPEVKTEFETREGREAKVYKDTQGNDTVGVGFNMDDAGAKAIWKELGIPEDFDEVKAGTTELSDASVDELFEETYDSAVEEAGEIVSFEGVPQQAQDVLVDLVFNMGKSKVKNGFPSFVKNMKAGNYADAADELEFSDPNAEDPKQTDYIKQVKGRGRANLKKLRALGNGNN